MENFLNWFFSEPPHSEAISMSAAEKSYFIYFFFFARNTEECCRSVPNAYMNFTSFVNECVLCHAAITEFILLFTTKNVTIIIKEQQTIFGV